MRSRVGDIWPAPRRPPGEPELTAAIDEYERRALALDARRGAYQRRAFKAYRTLAAQMRGWLAHGQRRRAAFRAAIVVPDRRVESSLFREALAGLGAEREEARAPR